MSAALECPRNLMRYELHVIWPEQQFSVHRFWSTQTIRAALEQVTLGREVADREEKGSS